jgi:ATP-dependent helicase HrpA
VFEWSVPGRREELVEAMVRSLPKSIRRRFVPIADTVDTLVATLDPAAGAPREAVRRELSRLGAVAIPPDAFDLDALPPHLLPRFRIVDDAGAVIAEGGDLAELKEMVAADARASIAAETHDLERTGLTRWDLGELPKSVEIGEAGHRAPAYPALVDEGESVAVRLLATPGEQADAMWAGTIRLLLLSLPSPRRLFTPLLSNNARLAIGSGPYQAPADWVDDCLGSAVGAILVDAGGPAWEAGGFDALLVRTRDELADRATAVAEESLALLDTVRRIEIAVARLGDPRYSGAVDDVFDQVGQLVYPGFLAGVGADRVPDVHRYLRAVERRLDRLPASPEADRIAMVKAQELEGEYDRLVEMLPRSPELLDVAWMLQEYRVSLFAQSLGTRGKVSEKRIAQALGDLAG